jgi:hypothetical protein
MFRMRWAGHVAHMGKILQQFVGELVIKGSLRRPKRRWEDNMKMDHREIEWG